MARQHATSPIPATPVIQPRLFRGLVKNIHAAYDATDEDREVNGRLWYPRAHDMSRDFAGGDAVKGAGVVAALSPNQGWPGNVEAARETFRTGVAMGNTHGQNAKAQMILEGAHPLDILHGPKERSFFQNIHDPNTQEHVTIDRHAHDIAIGHPGMGGADRGLGQTPKSGALPHRYRHFRDAYIAAASGRGIDPAHMQAATWLHHTGYTGLEGFKGYE